MIVNTWAEIEFFSKAVRQPYSAGVMYWLLAVIFKEDTTRTLDKTTA